MSLTKIQLSQLRKIAGMHDNDPTNSDATKFALVKPSQVSALVNGGYIQINTAIVADAEGRQPARATAAGVELLSSSATAAAKPKPTFEVVVGISLPEHVRTNGREAGTSIYPFDKMAKGEMFFVPAEDGEKASDVAKKLASSVSSANKRAITNSRPLIENGVAVMKRGKPAQEHQYSNHWHLQPLTDGAPFSTQYAGKAGVAVICDGPSV